MGFTLGYVKCHLSNAQLQVYCTSVAPAAGSRVVVSVVPGLCGGAEESLGHAVGVCSVVPGSLGCGH